MSILALNSQDTKENRENQLTLPPQTKTGDCQAGKEIRVCAMVNRELTLPLKLVYPDPSMQNNLQLRFSS